MGNRGSEIIKSFLPEAVLRFEPSLSTSRRCVPVQDSAGASLCQRWDSTSSPPPWGLAEAIAVLTLGQFVRAAQGFS